MPNKTQMQEKTVLVTGANSGIGKVTALELAKMGAHVVMACRSAERGAAAQKEIIAASGSSKVELMLVDMASMASIRSFAEQFNAKYDRLDVLVNNAGLIADKWAKSEDGIEMTFAVNHLGYFLTTTLLLDLLKASAPARIVNVASALYRIARVDFDDLEHKSGYSSFPVYAESKLLNVLFTNELAQQLEGSGVTVNSLHPGLVGTNFGHGGTSFGSRVTQLLLKYVSITPEKGAETQIYLASSPAVEGKTGQYWTKKKPAKLAAHATNLDTQRKLWEISERLVSAV